MARPRRQPSSTPVVRATEHKLSRHAGRTVRSGQRGLRLLAALAVLPMACAAPAHAASGGGIAVPESWNAPSPPAPTAPADERDGWWHIFGDAQLGTLIEQANRSNTSLAIAAARLDAARSAARLADGTTKPQVTFGFSASRAEGPLINDAGGSGSLFVGSGQLSWELDLSGRLGEARKAARYDAAAAAALLRDTRLEVQTSVAYGYFKVQFLQAELELADRHAALLDEKLAVTNARADHGLSARGELDALAARIAEFRQTRADLQQTLAEARNMLAFLCGAATPAELTQSLPQSFPAIPAGLPAQVLARRPDVEAAYAMLSAADHRYTAARRAWLPNLALTAAGGSASSSLTTLLSAASRQFGLGMLLELPLFDGGRHKAEAGIRKAQVAEARARYEEVVVRALREVNDALAGWQAATVKLDQSAIVLAARSSAEATAANRRKLGTIGALAELAAREDANEAARDRLRQQFVRLDATLRAIRSLGGGWSEPAPCELETPCS